MANPRDDAKTRMKSLVERYEKHRSDHLSASYNETQLRNDYLNSFLKILGWDVKNDQKLPSFLREVIQEEPVEVEDEINKKKPDYTIRIDGNRKFFFEAKKPSVNILSSDKSAFQTRRYGWNANLAISILSNFENLSLYDCRFKPEVADDVRVACLYKFSYKEYVSKFDKIYDLFSKESVISGQFDTCFKIDEVPRGAEPFDTFFLEQIESWRELLAKNLIKNNPGLIQSDLNYLIQQTINRIIFLRICEDRDLEKYEELKSVKDYKALKKLFRDADKKYDSGLFDFIEDKLSLKVTLDDSVLISIFNDLYYPQNPYAFSVVDPRVLGEIYELFLSRELIIQKRGKLVVLQEKPEVVQSKGAVPTPQHIVDKILSQTLFPLINGKTPLEISKLRIADIACGSGVFLLAVYDMLMNYHLEWYINNTPLKHQSKIIKLSTGEWKLSLAERTRILQDNIFGVDIDPQFVEVTRFSLLLKTLEGVSIGEIDAFMKKHKRAALPNINSNIQWGNSLVNSNYFNFNESFESEGQLVEINPFDFNEGFEEIINDGGFDLIIGNPPYLRIQNIVKYSPLEVGYYASDHSPYETSKSDSYDKYYLFIERSLALLKTNGLLGFIVPHKFMTIKAGKNLRDHLSKNSYVSRISHFGVNQIFEGKSATYTCILILKKSDNDKFEVEFVKDLTAWKHGAPGALSEIESKAISSDPWVFVPPDVNRIFKRLQSDNPKTLGDVANIFVGVQTSADKIYIIKSTKTSNRLVHFTDKDGVEWKIERSILRPCLLDVPLECFGRPKHNSFMIFPYWIDKKDNAKLYSQKEMKSKFPKCWDYLKSHKKKLKKRSIQGQTPQTWYRFGRSQSLVKFHDEPKLIWPVLSLEPRYSYDDSGVVITGGGNGPYYTLRPKPDSGLSIYYLLGILSHPVIEAFVRVRSSKFRGGYGSHGRQYVTNIPIKTIDFDEKKEVKQYKVIVDTTEKLITVLESFHASTTPNKRTIYKRQLTVYRKKLFGQIEKLYNLSQEDLKTVLEFESSDDE